MPINFWNYDILLTHMSHRNNSLEDTKLSLICFMNLQEHTPRSTKSSTSISDVCDRPRRKRQEFSQDEIDNLITGVGKSGKHWNFILWSYKFKPGRTAVDLKDKYRRMQVSYNDSSQCFEVLTNSDIYLDVGFQNIYVS